LIHVFTCRGGSDVRASRTLSLLTHVMLVSGILLLSVPLRKPPGDGPETQPHAPFTFSLFHAGDNSLFGRPSLGVKSGGGENDVRPAKHGVLAPGSSMPILPPRQVVNTAPELPIPSFVFDPTASQFPFLITNLGLSWMKDDSNSAGPGSGHGFGSGKKGGMG